MELIIDQNFEQVKSQFQELTGKLYRGAQAEAMELAMASTAKFTASRGKANLDKPIPAIFDKKRGKNRLGWIWWTWDKPAQIRTKNNTAEARLELQGFGPADRRAIMQEAIHRNIYGTVERKGVTPKIPYIIFPSKHLTNNRGNKAPFPFIRMDDHGNIKNFKSSMKKAMNDKKNRFFHIAIGQTGGGRFNNGKSLPAGLYFRKTKKRKYRKNKHTGRRGGPYNSKRGRFARGGGDQKKDETIAIMTVFRYQSIRDYKRSWKFKEESIPYLERKYTQQFRIILNREIRRQATGSPTRMKRLGGSFGQARI